MDYRYRSQKSPRKHEPERTVREAKLKALRILERMDRTEAQLRQKLSEADFDLETIEQAIDYVKGFGYLDDERYVRNYIELRKDRKSRRQLEQELQYNKGVPAELIQRVYENMEPTDEKTLIRRFLAKKQYVPAQCDEKQRQKLMASLMRRGFRMSDILSVMKEEPEV